MQRSHPDHGFKPFEASYSPHGNVPVAIWMRRCCRLHGTPRLPSHFPISSLLTPVRMRKSVLHVLVTGLPICSSSNDVAYDLPHVVADLNSPLWAAARPSRVASLLRSLKYVSPTLMMLCSVTSCSSTVAHSSSVKHSWC